MNDHAAGRGPALAQRVAGIAGSATVEMSERIRQAQAAGISCAAPPATFYLFPKVGGDDKQVAAEWLETLAIAALPGSAFGPSGAGHLRLSLACSDEILDEALARLRRHYRVNR